MLQDPRVATALDRMHTEASEQTPLLRDRRDEFERLSSASAQERADALSAFYIPVTPEAGRLLYSLVRATRSTTIGEFGTLTQRPLMQRNALLQKPINDDQVVQLTCSADLVVPVMLTAARAYHNLTRCLRRGCESSRPWCRAGP